MKKFKVRFGAQAESDLRRLYMYVAEGAGDEVAEGYIDRIDAACTALETFPKRGRARDDISAGLRIMSFERRATIVFRVMKAKVDILRIFSGGQDYERMLLRMADE